MLERIPVTNDDETVNADWSIQHRDFHQGLLAGCNNARLDLVCAGARRGQSPLAAEGHRIATAGHCRAMNPRAEALTC